MERRHPVRFGRSLLLRQGSDLHAKAVIEELPVLLKLRQKSVEAKAKSDMLITQHRRPRAMSKVTGAGRAMGDRSSTAAFDRMKEKVHHTESTG